MELCGKEVGYEKFGDVYGATCQRPQGHRGSCEPFLVEGDRINGQSAAEIRQESLRDALAVVEGEHLEDPNQTRAGEPESGDDIYDRAVRDCADAIRRLLDKEPTE